MINSKEFDDLKAELLELKKRLITSEERRNSQFTDIMNELTKLTEALETQSEEEKWENENLSVEAQQEDDDLDELFETAKEFVINENKASTSLLQRKFGIGYGRAARLMDQLEEKGVISASDGTNKPREVLEEKET